MTDLLASRCPRCRRLVVPPASLCPDHPVKMEAAMLPPLGEVDVLDRQFGVVNVQPEFATMKSGLEAGKAK